MELDVQVTDLARDLLITTILLAGPVLLIGLLVGIMVSLFQALTSIQEQTMSLIPKMFAVMLVTLILMAPALQIIRDFTIQVFGQLASFGLSWHAVAPGTLESFGLYLVRVSAWVLASPLIGAGAHFSGFRIGLIGVLSLLFYSVDGAPLAEPPAGAEYALFALREMLIGLFLAFVLQTVLMAVRVAGHMVGHEMTFSMSSLVDPATGINTPVITRMYEGFFFLGLLAVDGHHWLIRTLAGSFERAPVGRMAFESDAVSILLSLFKEMFAAGITFAAPVLALLSIVSLMIGFLSRAVPQLNVLEIGFTLRIIVGFAALFLFAPLIAPALQDLFAHLDAGLDAVLEAM